MSLTLRRFGNNICAGDTCMNNQMNYIPLKKVGLHTIQNHSLHLHDQEMGTTISCRKCNWLLLAEQMHLQTYLAPAWLRQYSQTSWHSPWPPELQCHSNKLIPAHNPTPYQTGIRTLGNWNLSQLIPGCGSSVPEWDPEVGDGSTSCVGQTHW